MIDRYGRKPRYIIGSLGMTAVLLSMVVASATGHFTGLTVLALIMAFIAFFASCIGPVFWTLVPEIFPNRVRGTAMIVPVLTQWLANAIAVQFFPIAFNQVGKVPTFCFLAVMAFLQVIFTWRFVPETKGKTLEEIEELWNGGARKRFPLKRPMTDFALTAKRDFAEAMQRVEAWFHGQILDRAPVRFAKHNAQYENAGGRKLRA